MKTIHPIFLVGIFLVLGVILFSTSCRKEIFTTDVGDSIELTTDTLTFDTVFTTVGSTTEFFKIVNPHAQSIKTNVSLAGGQNSNFRINVDGIAGTDFTDVTVNPDDSLYVFVEVTVDPDDNTQPFILEDSIMFETNGNMQKVLLTAYGQNAVFLNNIEICDTTLTDNLPYVFYNIVYVPEGCELNIEEGVRIHMHRNARFLVEGTLNINGKVDSVVTFQGDRLESYFDDRSAQWFAIELLRGSTANINFAHIKNGIYGFLMGSILTSEFSIDDITAENAPLLSLNNSIIENCLLSGISGFLSAAQGRNSLIHSCGENNLQATFGGYYNFVQCTFANYGTSSLSHRDPIINISNAIEVPIDEMTIQVATAPTDLYMGNCIIYGLEDEEIAIAPQLEGGDAINFSFENCLVKTERNIDTLTFINCLKNPSTTDTLFMDRTKKDYRLHSLSPAIDLGTSNIDFPPIDLKEEARPNGANPDAGCYEFYEE